MAASVSGRYVYNSTSYVNGYLEFLEGPLTIQDKVYYSVSITGQDISQCTVSYDIVVDGEIKVNGVLDPTNTTDSDTDLKVGYGHEYAQLNLHFNGTTKTIVSYAD